MSQEIQNTDNTECHIVKTEAATERVLEINTADATATIEETRKVSVKQGRNKIQAEGVPNNVEPRSISVDAESVEPFEVRTKKVLTAESLSIRRILKEFEGIKIKLHYTTNAKWQTYDGKFRLAEGDQIVMDRFQDEVHGTMIARQPEAIFIPGRPKDLREAPALLIEAESAADQEVELTLLYRARGVLGCTMSHNIVYNELANTISLESNAELVNRSGCDWEGVKINLISGGESQRRAPSRAMKMASTHAFSYDESTLGGSPPAAESVGERKLFELPPGLSLKNGETKVVQLLKREQIPVVSEYYLQEDEYENQPAQLKLTFKNLESEKLGLAIPSGPAIVYQRKLKDLRENPNSKRGRHQTAETNVEEASVGETVKLELGATADIKASRRFKGSEETQLGSANAGKRRASKTAKGEVKQSGGPQQKVTVSVPMLRRDTYEIELKNLKERDVAIVVPHTLGDKQRIVGELSHFLVENSSGPARAVVNVPARTEKGAGEVRLTYIVETTFEKEIGVSG